ncbi:MAG: hypothetical protein JST75_22095 [Bacteroidetes bacterium]|nr:hypothetical protein [Bacteroidota bacterium]
MIEFVQKIASGSPLCLSGLIYFEPQRHEDANDVLQQQIYATPNDLKKLKKLRAKKQSGER